MAKESLTSFAPGDVLRVLLQCTNCEGEIAFSIKRSIPNVPEECPLCPQDWSQSARYEDYKARVELLCRALELLSVTDDGVFYDSAGDDESDWAPWTVRLVIEDRPSSRERVSSMSTPRPTARPPMAQISPEMERETLVSLFNATGGLNWNRNKHWLSDVPIGEWEGVATDVNGRVIGLSLERNQLTGQIPPELGNLTNLSELYLSGNQLSGEIPLESRNLANLSRLDLGGNQLSGEIPPELGKLTNLSGLYLDQNQLSGEIPPELDELTNLKDLSLYGNQLSGEIPLEMCNLTNLTRLSLSTNQLSGEIPPEMCNLTNLTRLSLDGNQLSGGIPPELGKLTNLTLLDLSGNQLTGEIPPELGNLARLTWLHLDENHLRGCVPSSLSGRLDMDNSDLGDLSFCP